MTKFIHTVAAVIALGLMGPAWATSGPAQAKPSPSGLLPTGPSVQVKGAKLQTGEPWLLSLRGGTATVPSFAILTYAVKANPKWLVTSISGDDVDRVRVGLKSQAGALLSLDASRSLATSLALKTGDEVLARYSSAGRGAMVVLYRDSTPLGLVPNDEITLPN